VRKVKSGSLKLFDFNIVIRSVERLDRDYQKESIGLVVGPTRDTWKVHLDKYSASESFGHTYTAFTDSDTTIIEDQIHSEKRQRPQRSRLYFHCHIMIIMFKLV
jgi:hypothetical protein